VGAEGAQRRLAGRRRVHEHHRQPRAVLLAQRHHLPGEHVEEADPGLDLEQRLGADQAHARAETAVELDDHEPVEDLARLALRRLRQVLEPRQVGQRLELRAGQLAGVGGRQLLEPTTERGELGGVGAGGLRLGEGGVHGAGHEQVLPDLR
jgi:hypothetical protein